MAAVVLLRGLMRDKRHWGEFETLLQSRLGGCHHVLAIDTIGNGEFASEISPLNIMDYTAAIIDQLVQIKEDEIYIVGLSMGGMIALELGACLKEYGSTYSKQSTPKRLTSLSPTEEPQVKPLNMLANKTICGMVIINSSAANLSAWYKRFQLKQLILAFRRRVKGIDSVNAPKFSNDSFFNQSPNKKSDNSVIEQDDADKVRPANQIVFNRPLNPLEATVIALTSATKGQDIELITRWSELRKVRCTSLLNAARQVYASSRFEANPVNLPITVFSGLDDKLVEPSCSQALATYYQAPLVSFEHGGHDLSLDCADDLCSALIKTWKLLP